MVAVFFNFNENYSKFFLLKIMPAKLPQVKKNIEFCNKVFTINWIFQPFRFDVHS